MFMSLADVLTAVRKLILDPIELPEDQEKRRAVYEERFPKLRPEEVDDLSKMEPKRLRTYTSSIFAGQTSILEDKFELTFAILTQRFESELKEKFYSYDFVRELHAARPWLDNDTEGLGRNLVEYLKHDRPEIVVAAPEIIDVAEMELSSLQVIRAPNDVLSARDSIGRKQLESLPVSQLMQVEMFIPAYVQFRTFRYDAPGLRRAFYNNNKSVSAERPQPRQVRAVVSRNSEFFVRWRELEQPVYELLNELPRSTPTSIEDLAAVVADLLPSGADEVEVFRSFFGLASGLAEGGVIVLR